MKEKKPNTKGDFTMTNKELNKAIDKATLRLLRKRNTYKKGGCSYSEYIVTLDYVIDHMLAMLESMYLFSIIDIKDYTEYTKMTNEIRKHFFDSVS